MNEQKSSKQLQGKRSKGKVQEDSIYYYLCLRDCTLTHHGKHGGQPLQCQSRPGKGGRTDLKHGDYGEDGITVIAVSGKLCKELLEDHLRISGNLNTKTKKKFSRLTNPTEAEKSRSRFVQLASNLMED